MKRNPRMMVSTRTLMKMLVGRRKRNTMLLVSYVSVRGYAYRGQARIAARRPRPGARTSLGYQADAAP